MTTLMSFSGLPGVGKTTIARALAQELRAAYLRVDSVEASLKRSALRIQAAEDAGYLVLAAIAADNLRNGISVVADTVNPLAVTRNLWSETAASCHARLVNVEVICSDQVEHRRRVEARRSDIAGLDVPDWQRVQARVFESWTGSRVTIDTSVLSVADCVARLVHAVRSAP